METKIIKQESNPFLEREEFLIEIISHSTPTKESIVEDLGKSPELTIVRKIHTNFGRQSLLADVVVYSSVEAKEKYTVIPKKVRIKMEAEKKEKMAAEKKAAEEARKAEEAAKAAAEAPVEEIKEDAE
jgi:ribosomal protein S24E